MLTLATTLSLGVAIAAASARGTDTIPEACPRDSSGAAVAPLFPIVDESGAQWGLIDARGQVVVPTAYQEIAEYPSSATFGRHARVGDPITAELALSMDLRPLCEERIAVKRDGLWGFVDRAGTLVVPPQFQRVTRFSEGRSAVQLEETWGYVNADGALVIPAAYEDATPFFGGIAFVRQGGRWGIIDRAGAVIAPPRFDSLGRWLAPESAADPRPVFVDGGWRYVDRAGQLIGDTALEQAIPFRSGIANVKAGGRWGYMDRSGRMAVPAIYDMASPFEGDLGAVERDGKWALIDRSGTVVSERWFDDLRRFGGEALAPVKVGRRWGYVNRAGRIVTEPAFSMAWAMSDGMGLIVRSGRVGFVDSSGAVAIEPRFENALRFSEGLSPARLRSGLWTRWGYIDGTGAVAIEPRFGYAGYFRGGLAVVAEDGRLAYIDRTGAVVYRMGLKARTRG
jgi:hypothetical protein